jgi:DNA-binding MarR family transcriptional regulator
MLAKTTRDPVSLRAREVLRFDRFYARRLREAIDAARVHEVNRAALGIYQELLHSPCSPGWLSWRLDLDPGYLSRSLGLLELNGHITVSGTGGDRRMRQASLTDRGRYVARGLAQFQEDAVRKALEELPPRQQRRLVRAMKVIIDILERDALTNLLECHT